DGQLLTTRILSKDVTQQRNFLTLDAGAEDGVEEGMAVVDDEGIIGKVVLTSRRYAVVQSYLNTDFRVPARIQDVGTDGIISWDGVDRMRLLLNFVPKTEPVVPGQEIVTYGSLTFPDGYVVGTVDTAFANEGRNDFQIYLTPATPIGRADYVFVILAKPDPVIEELMEVASQQ
ncbi:MAG: rod shape-determining protein MreC, partial [Bacteroidota bacterium]